jgi:hypothetical protein
MIIFQTGNNWDHQHPVKSPHSTAVEFQKTSYMTGRIRCIQTILIDLTP